MKDGLKNQALEVQAQDADVELKFCKQSGCG